MTAAPAVAPDKETAKTVALESQARALAETQQDLCRVESGVGRFIGVSTSRVVRALDRAWKHLSATTAEDPARQKAAEWFLDNYYLIRRVARQVAEDLPAGFLRRLPRLASGPAKGVPRIDALARALLVTTGLEIDADALQGFLHAYQEVSSLTIAELWAFPTMLRASLLHCLLQFLEPLNVPVHRRPERAPLRRMPPDVAPFALGPEAGVERAIRAMRLLAEIDWKSFFEKTNRVEAILRGDPTGVYERMDFETCDTYRRTVEQLAWATGTSEEEVAERAVELAREGLPDLRSGHVGYYLVDGGTWRARGSTRLSPRRGRAPAARAHARPTLSVPPGTRARDRRASLRPRAVPCKRRRTSRSRSR